MRFAQLTSSFQRETHEAERWNPSPELHALSFVQFAPSRKGRGDLVFFVEGSGIHNALSIACAASRD
jgi:hypothetical protein